MKNNNRNHFARGVKIQRVETRLKRKYFLQVFFFVCLAGFSEKCFIHCKFEELFTHFNVSQTSKYACFFVGNTVCKKFLFCLSSTALRNIFQEIFSVQDVIVDRFLNFFLRQRTIQEKTMLCLYHKIKPTTRKHPAWLKIGLLTVTDEKFGFLAQSAYVLAKNKSG